ncbi:ABC transporter ATP-binding protein [Mycoplasma leonicaptivi]|uniref:ABC transporter ATP-binding protein n=1 Tax=Mycoplasma leonicaptivi TaxID=36742 RepID=UPI00068814C0|nr:ABC transporter ATP-binding protein [Mycoplasma leonicaptivi]
MQKQNNIKDELIKDSETPEQKPVEEVTVVAKGKGSAKINKKNVFEILDSEDNSNRLQVDSYIARKLRKASNKKRPKDEFFNKTNSEGNIIEVQGVSKYYLSGNIVSRVLKNVSLEIKKGEFVMIFGKSGGGKSTLLNLISGLDRPSRGNVIVCDTNLPYLSDNKLTLFRRAHISFIFQNYNLLQNLNGFDNVKTGGYLQKDPAKKLNIDDLFKEFGLEEIKDKYPSQMSGGQQQRISILRALAKNSEIIFADEPTAALDEQTTSLVLSYLFDINKKYNTTIVMVTHNPHIANIADKIVYVKNGKIKDVKINNNPLHPSTLNWEN